MADPRTFVLIGKFDDQITPALVKINASIDALKKNLAGLSDVTKPLKKDFRQLASLSTNFSSSLKSQASDIRDITAAMKAMRSEMGRMNRAYRAASRNRNIVPPPPPPPRAPRATLPPPPPPPRTPRTATPGYGRRGGGYTPPTPPTPPSGGRQSVMGDVISGNLISNAIIQGFQVGVGILQQGMSAAFGAFAERAKDQLEDIGAAGGIFSAGQFANIPGFPKTFQGAMEMQDKINKEMAAIASTLPGTTHDYVANSRRLVDTTAQVMAKDLQNFTKLATELTGKVNMSAEEAFQVVNVEIAKATTMLEKLNPAKTVIPMTQLVEDMMKDEKITIGGLRRYVSFRRSTTFEAALQRNIDELNKTGAGTAARLKMIIKVLKQAAPPEMVGAFQSSVAGVVEGFRSALMDPDVGIFGLSRTLSLQVKKFDRETGKYIGTEFTNFFKLFGEVFGNLGNLINNSIMPGLQALYEPFKAIAEQFVKLRETSYEIFRRQQEYTAYFDQKADEYGMRREDFKVFEKGGVSVLMDILQGFNMLDKGKYESIMKKMKAKGTAEEVAKNMKEVYADIIPAIFESPFFKNIGTTLGKALASVFKEIAKIMKALLGGQYGTSEFLKAFYDAGGMDAINEILMYVAEGIGKILMGIAQAYIGALTKAIGSGNFAAAGVLGALGLVFGAPAIAGIKIIASGMKLLVNAFKFLLNAKNKIVPAQVQDLGSRITDPRKMLPPAGETALATAGKTGPLAKGMGAVGKFFMTFGNYIKGVGPRFMGFFKGFLGKLTIFGGVITSIVSLFQGKDLATSLAEGAGPVLGAALGAALIPFLGPIGPMIGSLIGGWVGSLDAVTVPLTEVFNNLFGSLQGFGDSIMMVVTLTGDLFGALGDLVGSIFGVKGEFDGLRLILMPFTLAFQALEVGLKGFAVLLAEMRVFFKRYFGSSEEYKEAIAERDRLKLSMLESQGRANAYNMGSNKELLKEGLAKALGEYNTDKTMTKARAAELKAFIDAARKQLGKEAANVAATPGTKPAPGQTNKPTSAKQTKPEAKDTVQANLRAKAGQDLQWLWKKLTTAPEPPKKTTKEPPVGERIDKDIARLITAKPAKEVTQTAQNTNNLNKKATDQIKETTSVKSGVDKTTQAVNSLAAKITPQTNLQTTTAAIYNLLASGQLRVQGSVGPGSFSGSYNPYTNPLGDVPFKRKQTNPNVPNEIFGAQNWAKGGLGDAVASEMKNKPRNSDLVIANSSETVIPAAGGHGMVDFVDTLKWGFATMIGAFKQAQQKQDEMLSSINQTLKSNQQQTNTRLAAMEKKFSTPGIAGGLGGAAAGGVDAFTPIAQKYGLQMTSGYRPGDPGWHGANRARDFSNGTGPTPQMMQFAQYMASTYGSNLKELIYTPLGFSIKNGQRVAPYAQGSHYNHVHVAYAMGLGNGIAFNSLKGAQAWENSMVPGSVKVGSVTTNSREGFGSSTVGDIYVTVNAGSTNDPDQLAYMVAERIQQAVGDAVNANILV